MEKKYKCDICGKCFSNKSKLVDHIRIHTKEKPFVCSTCNKGFTQKSQLTTHTRIHTNDRPYVCGTCDKRFIQKGQLVSHITSLHTKEKSFVCELCKKAFGSKSNLWTHITAVHKKERPHVCELCEKAFTWKKDLKVHMISKHRKERPFGCEFCKKTFKFNKHMIKHMKRMHTSLKNEKKCAMEKELLFNIKEKNYECKACSKAFSRKACLVRHLRVHTKERPYICDVCSKPFSDRGNLLKHQRLHTKVKPYSCNVCHRAFSLKSTLMKHMNVHECGKRFLCQICRTGFLRKDELTIHLGIHLNPSNQVQNLNPKDNQFSSEVLDVDHDGERVTELKQAQGEECEVAVSNVQNSDHVESKKEVKVEVFSESVVGESEDVNQVIDVKEYIMEEQSDLEDSVRTLCSETSIEKNVQMISMHKKEGPFLCEVWKNMLEHMEHMHIFPKTVKKCTMEKNYVCEMCSKAFSRKACLVRHLRVHTKERPFVCNFCSKPFSDRGNLHKHQRVHTKEKPYSCDVCHRAFSLKSTLVKHMKVHEYGKRFSCQICRTGFPRKEDLTIHMGIHLNPSNQVQDLNPKNNQFSSEVLDVGEACEVAVSDMQTSDHIESEKEVKVEVCDESFVGESENINQVIDVKESIMEKQSNVEDSVIPLCSQTDLEKNVPIIACESYNNFEICSTHFSHENAFVNHMRTDKKGEPFNYGSCKKTFFEEGAVNLNPNATQCSDEVDCENITDEKDMEQNEHVAKVHVLEKSLFESSVEKVEVICDESIEVFEVGMQCNERDEEGRGTVEKMEIFSESVQKAHVGCKTIQQMEEVPETPSKIAKKVEVRESFLDEENKAAEHTFKEGGEIHKQYHQKEKLYTCDVCSKPFPLKSRLAMHMRVHTKEKPFACSICSKAFSWKTSLEYHMRIHTKAKPFQCDICNQTFSVKSNLTRHMYTHTEPNFFTCETCNQSFLERAQLEEHKKIHTVTPVNQVQYVLLGLPLIVINQ